MEHYYSKNPSINHDIGQIEYIIDNKPFQFITDSGVFSKKRVDFGSDLLINSIPESNGKILDMGCGYGVIGISLAIKNPEGQIYMADINQRAIELTNKNIELNKLTNAKAFESDGFTNVKDTFNIIVSNPPIRTGKKVIYPIFEDSISFLEPGGSFYIVIQKKQGANSALEKLLSIYGNCEIVKKDSGYQILRSIKK